MSAGSLRSGDAAGRVVGIQRSNGGVPKLAVERAEVRVNGIVGDVQANRRFHGGPTRALCLYSAERIAALVGEGHPVVPGKLGENVTIGGLPWEQVTPGVVLRIGDVEVEVTSYTSPCTKVAPAFRDGDFTRIGQKVNPGWSRVYVAIRRQGWIAVGDPVHQIATLHE
jgi:MOSC domain-containing protein YiiM